MIDDPMNAPLPARREPIPITWEELMADWDANLDRVFSGETFMVVVHGKPSHYFMPFAEYEALKRLETKPISE